MQTFMETEQKKYIKKFHWLLGKTGRGQEAKEAILASYGVESSRDLSVKDLLDICERLATESDPKLKKLDVWRKRVIKTIFSYCAETGREADMDYVKGIACRACGFKSFNRIPIARLISVYNAFKCKVNDIERVNGMSAEDLLNTISLN